MENTIDNIKLIIKEMKTSNNVFVIGCIKYFKKNKSLSDKQFDIIYSLYKEQTKND